MEVNRHHILHYKDYWRANKANRKLMQSVGMLAVLDVDVHTELHKDVPAPPPLDVFMSQQVVALYEPHTNPLQGIDNFRFAVEQAARHPHSHELERQLAMLTIEAVTLQLPFIREGLVADEY